MNWWKLYFWIYLILSVVNALLFLPEIFISNFASWVDMTVTWLVTFGVYSLAYKKHVNVYFWKSVFVAILAIWIAELFLHSNVIPGIVPYLEFLRYNDLITYNTIVISVTISLPAMYAIYKLGFAKTSKKH